MNNRNPFSPELEFFSSDDGLELAGMMQYQEMTHPALWPYIGPICAPVNAAARCRTGWRMITHDAGLALQTQRSHRAETASAARRRRGLDGEAQSQAVMFRP